VSPRSCNTPFPHHGEDCSGLRLGLLCLLHVLNLYYSPSGSICQILTSCGKKCEEADLFICSVEVGLQVIDFKYCSSVPRSPYKGGKNALGFSSEKRTLHGSSQGATFKIIFSGTMYFFMKKEH